MTSLSINFGTQENGTPFIYDLNYARNMFIASTSYSDDFLPYILLPLLEHNSPEQLEIITLGSIYNNNFSWDVIPHITTITDETKFFSCLTDIATEIQHRSELLLQTNCSDISEYNNTTKQALQYKIIIIQSLQSLLNIDKNLTLQCLNLICKYGPHVGVFLIAEFNDEISPQKILDLFHAKLIFPQFDTESFLRLTNDIHTQPLLIHGDKECTHGKAMFYIDNVPLSKFKINYLSHTEKQKTVHKIINRYTPHQALPINFIRQHRLYI